MYFLIDQVDLNVVYSPFDPLLGRFAFELSYHSLFEFRGSSSGCCWSYSFWAYGRVTETVAAISRAHLVHRLCFQKNDVGSSVCRCLLGQCQSLSLWSRKVGLNTLRLVCVCVNGSTTKPDTAAIRSRSTRANGWDYFLDSENTNSPSLRNLSKWSTRILQYTWRVCHGLW